MINEVITIAIRLRYDFDATTIRLRHIARACFQFDASKKMNMSIFRRARSRIVVESQLWYRIGLRDTILFISRR